MSKKEEYSKKLEDWCEDPTSTNVDIIPFGELTNKDLIWRMRSVLRDKINSNQPEIFKNRYDIIIDKDEDLRIIFPILKEKILSKASSTEFSKIEYINNDINKYPEVIKKNKRIGYKNIGDDQFHEASSVISTRQSTEAAILILNYLFDFELSEEQRSKLQQYDDELLHIFKKNLHYVNWIDKSNSEITANKCPDHWWWVVGLKKRARELDQTNKDWRWDSIEDMIAALKIDIAHLIYNGPYTFFEHRTLQNIEEHKDLKNKFPQLKRNLQSEASTSINFDPISYLEYKIQNWYKSAKKQREFLKEKDMEPHQIDLIIDYRTSLEADILLMDYIFDIQLSRKQIKDLTEFDEKIKEFVWEYDKYKRYIANEYSNVDLENIPDHWWWFTLTKN